MLKQMQMLEGQNVERQLVWVMPEVDLRQRLWGML